MTMIRIYKSNPKIRLNQYLFAVMVLSVMGIYRLAVRVP